MLMLEKECGVRNCLTGVKEKSFERESKVSKEKVFPYVNLLTNIF